MLIRSDLIAAAVGAVVGGVTASLTALILTGDSDATGNLAEWVAALGTVGALLLTYRLLRHEINTRHQDEEERLWGQARRVIVSAGMRVSSAKDPTTGRYLGPYEAQAVSEIRNDSAEPIVGCVLGHGLNSERFTVSEVGVVAPGKPTSTGTSWPTPLADGEEVRPFAVIRFTDARGRRWERTCDGALRRLADDDLSPPGPDIKPV